tara:strand:- start:797 stop:1264 length:468 start_codon:yes stop_codon:yes gene_type:complete
MKKISLTIYLLSILGAITWTLYNKQPMKENIELIAVIAIVGMYLMSGLEKINPFKIGGDDVQRLVNKYAKYGVGVPLDLTTFIVFFGGLVEFISSILLFYGVVTNKKSYRTGGAWSLIAFTILATLMMYANPIVGVSVIPVMSNINSVGGLLAIL